MEIAIVENASKVYKVGQDEITALNPTTLSLRQGELTLIIGPSGSGKTTLISLIGCVIYPTSGRVIIQGKDTNSLNDKEMADLRLNSIGFLFQSFNLLSPLTAEENVMLPLQLQKKSSKEKKIAIDSALELVRMTHRRKSLPKMLSGGEQQRIAIARALVSQPPIILCDEPTAALDVKSVDIIMQELRKLAESGKALAVVTHDMRLCSFAHRIIEVENGNAKEVSV